MQSKRWIAGMVLFLGLKLVLGEPAVKPDSVPMSVQLEKGIYTEETVGNLDQAIEIYKKIIAEDQANRKLVAQAYFRLGMCHIKKGQNKEGTEILQKMVALYPEQKDLIARAVKVIQEKGPKVEFPEFAGCRIKETFDLFVKAENKIPDVSPKTQKTVYDESVLEFRWKTDPKIAGKVSPYAVGIAPLGRSIEKKEDNIWLMTNIPASVRQVTYGQPAPEGMTTVISKKLKSGAYGAYVFAYSTKASDFGEKDLIGASFFIFEVKPLPMTQIMIDDIQPDGTLRFRSMIQAINNAGMELKGDQFINSDFVHLIKMFDCDGQPLKFESKHEGNIYRYHFTYNKPILPGEPLM